MTLLSSKTSCHLDERQKHTFFHLTCMKTHYKWTSRNVFKLFVEHIFFKNGTNGDAKYSLKKRKMLKKFILQNESIMFSFISRQANGKKSRSMSHVVVRKNVIMDLFLITFVSYNRKKKCVKNVFVCSPE